MPTAPAPAAPKAEGGPEPPAAYLERHNIHSTVDRLVREILVEKPDDAGSWMQRWLLEQHRQQCAQRHKSLSPMKPLAP